MSLKSHFMPMPNPLSLLNKPHLQNWTLSSSSSLFLPCAIHARPKHGSSAGWGGLAVANAFRNRLLSSSSNPCLTCSIYVVWNCLETGPIWGAYFCFRVASMWHILVRLVYGCREIWGSCAIYVGIPSLILANEWELRHLCPKKAAWYWEKIIGGNQRRRLQKIDHHLGTYMAQLTCFEWELSHLSPAFCIWHRWRNSRFWAIYF